MTREAAAPFAPSNAVADWFAGKDPAELEVLEYEIGNQRLYPDSLKRRCRADRTKFEEVKVRIRVPTSRDKALAKLDALVWARELAGEVSGMRDLPPTFTIKDAEAYLGAFYFDELDTKCIVARCTHEWEAPHGQYMLPQMLDKHHEHASILDVWDRLLFWNEHQDVRHGELTEQQFIQVLAAIDRVRNVSPLAAIGGSARDSCIVSMAVQLRSFLMRQPS